MPLDPAHYTTTQNFGGQFLTLDELLADGMDYLVVSDTWSFEWNRSPEFIPAESLAAQDAAEANWSTRLKMMARIDRPT